LATKSQKIATPVICPFLPDQVGLKYGKSRRTPFKFVRKECAKSRHKVLV
jgi:hypothetical protein